VVRGVGQSGGVARWRRAETPGTRRRDRHRSEVSGDLQHHWLSTPQRQVDRPVDQRRGVGRVLHREGSGCDLCIDLPLIVVSHLAQGVVDDFVLPLRVAVDPPTMTMTGESSEYAPVTAFRALSPPTL